MSEKLKAKQASSIPGAEFVSGGWTEGQDSIGNQTWSLTCAHGTADITDEATTVPSKRNGAHYKVDVKPIEEEEVVDFKWSLPDAQGFALNKLGFQTEAVLYEKAQLQDLATKLDQ